MHQVKANKKAIARPSNGSTEKKVNTYSPIYNNSISQKISLCKELDQKNLMSFGFQKVNLTNILYIIDKYQEYLKSHGFKLNKYGYPIFKKSMFLDQFPDFIVTYAQRNNKRVKNKEKTLLCFFDQDVHLYQRFVKVFNEIKEYKKYLGVVGIDVTFTNDMDEEWQKLTSLLNMLFMAVLVCNGIKIVLNTRSAGLNPQVLFYSIPKGVMAASGFLGCDKTRYEYDLRYISKILSIMPSKLIIYGKEDKIAENQLNIIGINYVRQIDFHAFCKRKEVA